MTAQPWLKFFPPDWRSDPALRVCSLAARGLWIEMLCVMHEASPRGTLRLNGQPMTPKQLSALVGAPMRDVQRAMDELEGAGVFSRDGEVVFSRRMVRDTEKAERDKANGKGGGNPTLKPPVKGGVNPPDKGEDKAQKLEARTEGSVSDANASSSAPPDEWGADRQKLFGGALQWLRKQTGRALPACRSQIGRWLKLTGDDATAVLGLIRQARDHDLAEPVAWIEAALKPGGKTNGHKPPVDWNQRADFYSRLGRWPAFWGAIEEIPTEYRHLFGDLFDYYPKQATAN